MKRKIALLLAAVLLVVALSAVLAACGDKNKDDGVLKLMVYSPETNDAKEVYKKMVEDFQTETGIATKVTFVPKDKYNERLQTGFKSDKTRPDVFYLDQPLLADYSDLCMNLDSGFFAADGEDGLHLSDFYDVAIDTVQYNGSTLAVPFSLTSSILLYNKSLVATQPKSWSEWTSLSVSSGKALFGGIGNGGYASWYFQAFLKSAGGEMIDGTNVIFNNAQGVAAATMVAELYEKSPKEVRESANAFVNGNVMFVLAHNSDIINTYNAKPTWCEENLGAMLFIPQNEDGTSYSNIGGENIAIYKNTTKAEQAKQLVKYLLREENVNKAISTNFSAIEKFATVPEKDPITGAAYSETLKSALAVVLEQIKTASARPVVKNWVKVNDNYLATALADILDNGTDVATALNTACDQAKAVLKFN